MPLLGGVCSCSRCYDNYACVEPVIKAQTKQVLQAFIQGANKTERYVEALAHLGDFVSHAGWSVGAEVEAAAEEMPPHKWWLMFGEDSGELADIAVKILAAKSNQGGAERNWSIQEFLHSTARNRLQHEHLEKATQIYANVRMLKKVTDPRHRDEPIPLPLETRATRRRDAEAAAAAAAAAGEAASS
eukprot:SAG31_NODE_4372_length_3301_cov_3.460962_4_plen_187_part_00